MERREERGQERGKQGKVVHGFHKSATRNSEVGPLPPSPDRLTSLTPKEEAFCQEYLVDFNAAAAARRAGYSKRTARSIGAENLTKPDIQARVRGLVEERADRTKITADRVIRELATLGLSRIDHYVVDEAGRVQLAPGAPANAIAAVSRVKHKQRWIPQKGEDPIHETETELWLWDKNTALTNLGRHLALFVDRVEHSGAVTLEQIIAESHRIERGDG